MKKLTALLLVTVIMLTSCAQAVPISADVNIVSAESEKQTELYPDFDEEVEINVMMQPYFAKIGDGSFEEYVIAKFTEKYPNITVNYAAADPETWENDIDKAQKAMIKEKEEAKKAEANLNDFIEKQKKEENGDKKAKDDNEDEEKDGDEKKLLMPDVYYDKAQNLAKLAGDEKLADLSDIYGNYIVKDLPEGVLKSCTATMTVEEEEAKGDKDDAEIKNDAKKKDDADEQEKEPETKEYYYMYPVSVSPYLMAFNKELVEQAGAGEFLPLDHIDRKWGTHHYNEFLAKLNEGLPEDKKAGVIYGASSEGDAGTRSLLINLYDAPFYTADEGYMFGGKEGKQAFEWLGETVGGEKLLSADSKASYADEVEAFLKGESAQLLVYTVGMQMSNETDFTTVLVPYPSIDGRPTLEYSMTGAAVFDNGDENKLKAAKLFVNFLATDEEIVRASAVYAGGISPRLNENGLRYEKEYMYVESLKPYLGVHYQTIEGFDTMQTYWFGAVNSACKKDAKTDDIVKTLAKNADKTLE